MIDEPVTLLMAWPWSFWRSRALSDVLAVHRELVYGDQSFAGAAAIW